MTEGRTGLLLAGSDFFVCSRHTTCGAQAPPKVASMFPLGRAAGHALGGRTPRGRPGRAYAVWLGPGSRLVPISGSDVKHTKGPDGLGAQVKAVPDGSRATVRLMIASDARVGFHSLGLVLAAGLSGTVSFWVGPDAVIQEAATPHHTPETAQPVKLPVAINGRLAEGGQLNYYAFDIAAASRSWPLK